MIEFVEVFGWLNFFEGSALSKAAMLLRDDIMLAIQDNRRMDAYQVLEQLKAYRTSRLEPVERAEIWVECAAAYYQLGNPYGCMQALKQALDNYGAASHRLAVTRLLLGIVQQKVTSERTAAIVSWQTVLEELEELRLKADYDNEQGRKAWYKEKIDQIRSEFDAWASHTANPQPRPGGAPQPAPPQPPPGGAPQPAPAPAAPAGGAGAADEGIPYTMDYLLRLVGQDLDVANRLVDAEEQRAPKASRLDHIKAAILRLLRDRQ